MKANASFIYLKATKHLVATFTRNGAAGDKFSDDALLKLLANDLRLRQVQQIGLTFSSSPSSHSSDIPFHVPAEDLTVLNKVIDDPYQEGAITRPLKFQVEDEQLKQVLNSGPDIALKYSMIDYTVKSDGVSVTLKPKAGTSLGDKSIRVWVLMRLGPEGVFDARTGEVPGSTTINEIKTGNIPFASIPAGKTHRILLMIQGLHPIWNEFTGTVTSTWMT
ncbi:hypothetical protein [Stieleria varia]|uniref:Uncharacterized protein n=1 Tax=Stieleria varia TaxID=2528005 RepID=A0A5C5ZXP1_9BACT|nr:hypothetical protein [Stieleria varia]TWT91751.1 hypothetical protein Pla52n_65010 [Stieleria varia]